MKSAGEVVDEEGEWGMIANSFVLLFSRSIDVGEKLGVDGSMLSHIAFQPLSSFLIYVSCICLTEDSASNILRLTQSLVQQNQLEHILREIGIKDVQHQLDTDVGADCLDLSDVGDGFLVRTVGAAGTLRPSVRSLPRSPREGGCPSGKVTN